MLEPWSINKQFVRFLVIAYVILIVGCEQSTQLERIKKQGELKVITKHPLTDIHKEKYRLGGFEHELVTAFAQSIGVKARFVYVDDMATLLRSVRYAKVHMAAAELVDTPGRRRTLRFSLPYRQVSEQLVYRRGARRPASFEDISSGKLHVSGASSHEETLQQTKTDHPELAWKSCDNLHTPTLLQAVEERGVSYTIAKSSDLLPAQQIYSHLRPAFEVEFERALAWAFPKSDDGSLRQAANTFLCKAIQNGVIERLADRYYDYMDRLNYVDKQVFRRHIKDRLPEYRDLFMEAAQLTGMDWRLLAAMSYQESHWLPDAVSPTGVRGLMMLTRATAKQMGVVNRMDPRESVLGGAKYLDRLKRRIPEHIHPIDRLWFALASYNVGLGHLEDARILTRRQGGDPDIWVQVKKRLPLLTEKTYFSTLKYGYARGHEPVIYVERIHNYYDLLIWYEQHPEALAGDQNADPF